MVLNYIFPIESPWLQKEDEPQVQINSPDFSIFVSSNEISSLSLLFQLAVSYASKGSNVTFISLKPLSTLPPCVHGMPQPDAKTLSTLKFLYLSTAGELTDYCSSIHEKSVLPDVVIVANFQSYLGHGKYIQEEHTGARLLAMLLDTVMFIKKSSQTTDGKLVVSCGDSVKWISSVAAKFNYQVIKVTGTEKHGGQIEWKSSQIHNLLTFKKQGEQLYVDTLTMQNIKSEQCV